MRTNIIRLTIILIFLIAQLGCSGGGTPDGGLANSADTMTVTISGPSGTVTKTYTEGSYNSRGNLDPGLLAYVTTQNYTNIEIHNRMGTDPDFTSINFHLNGNTPQSYPLGMSTTSSFSFSAYNQYYMCKDYTNPCGTITISNIGNVGGKITGTFDASLILVTSSSNTYDNVAISGSFNVTRDQ